jgi:hypothetical protein
MAVTLVMIWLKWTAIRNQYAQSLCLYCCEQVVYVTMNIFQCSEIHKPLLWWLLYVGHVTGLRVTAERTALSLLRF